MPSQYHNSHQLLSLEQYLLSADIDCWLVNFSVVKMSAWWVYSLVAISVVVLCANSQHTYTVSAPGGTTCPSCINLSEVVLNPNKYLTSNTTLNFLPGTHILDKDEPVEVWEVIDLTLVGQGEMEEGFHWTVKQSSVVIKCLNSTGGFVFNGSRVSIIGLTFTNCGVPIDERYLQHRYAPFKNGLYSSAYNFSIYSKLWATLYFIESPVVNLFQVSVQNCSGYCMYFLDNTNINFLEVYAAHNTPKQAGECCTAEMSENPLCIGGNLIFLYLSLTNCTDEVNHDFSVVMKSSSFSFGTGSSLQNVIMAGIMFINLKDAHLFVVVDSVTLYGNSGGNLGVLTAKSDFRFTNISSISANKYICPSVTLGIAFKISVTNELLCRAFVGYRTSTRVFIHDSLFTENLAIDAAGLNIDSSYVVVLSHYIAEIIFNVFNSNITNNRAALASCIGSGSIMGYPAEARLFLHNVTMSGNSYYDTKVSPYIGIPPSCIVLIHTRTALFNEVTISDHSLVGIFAITSYLEFSGKTLIANNTGPDRGGGLVLRENSDIVLNPNSTVSFIGNKAQFGAAMYVYAPEILAFVFRNGQLCVYQVRENPRTSNSHFYFSGNEASITGNLVYGGFISTCLLFFNSSVTPSEEFLPNIFKYQSTSPLYDVSSNAEKLCFCENGAPICGVKVLYTHSVYPGQNVNFSMIPVGQDNGLTVGKIDVTADYFNHSYNDSRTLYNATCIIFSVPIHFTSEYNFNTETQLNQFEVNFTLQLDSSSATESSQPIFVTVPVQPCPPGFAVNSSFACDCVSVLKEILENVTCNITDNKITHLGNVWIGFDEDTNSTIAGPECPFDYCHQDEVTFNILNPNLQCAFHRSGVLCGECADGYSLLLGTNECGECPNDNFLSLLLVFGVAGILLVVFLIVLNLTVSVGTINGLIFYANLVKINETIFFPNEPVLLLSNFISFINLDLGIETCFYHSMTPYAKVWLQFVFPVYIWVIILIIIILSHYSSRVSKLVGSNAVSVLATLVLLTYTKLIRTHVLVFRISHVYFESGREELVWAVDGNLLISETKHTILLSFSLFIFVGILLPFTVFVIVVPLFEYYISTKCGRLWLRFLKPISDAYSGPFNDSRRYWVGFGLVARLVLVVSIPFLNQTDTLLLVFFVVLFLLSLFALFGGYYKLKYLNYLEVWTNLNLLAMTVLALGNVAKIGSLISVSLILITFICVVLFHCVQQLKRYCFPRLPNELMSSVNSSKHKEEKNGNEQKEEEKRPRLMTSVTVLNFDNGDNDDRFRESLLDYVLDDS